jgi:hypothetical protein
MSWLSCVSRLAAIASITPVLLTAGCDKAAKLLDANNAQPGEADGRAVELTNSPSRFDAIAIDDTNMVVVQQTGDVFQRAKSNAPGPLTPAGSFKLANASLDEGVGFDADFVYLIEDINGFYRMPRAGGDPEKLDDGSGRSLAVAADSVFFLSHDHTAIRKLDKKSKAVADYVTGFKYAIAVALDEKGDKVWIADRDAETVSWIPTAQTGTTPPTATIVASNQAQPNTIGTGPDHVYWSNGSLSDHKDVTDKIFRIAKDGSGQPQLVTPTEATFVDSPMHADEQYLYYGQSAGGIMRVPIGGGTATKFLNICENGFALSADSVYVVENNANRFSDADKAKPNRVMAVTK